MSYTLHVASTYNVEWRDSSHFHLKSEEFHNFLRAVDIESCGIDDYIDRCPLNFEISKEDWQAGINRLRHINTIPEDNQTEIYDALTKLDTTLPEMIAIMEQTLHNAEPNWDFLEFSFF